MIITYMPFYVIKMKINFHEKNILKKFFWKYIDKGERILYNFNK